MRSALSALSVALLLGAGVPGRGQDDPRALMLQARAMQRRTGGDNPEGAAALYRKVIALIPTSSQAQLRLSEAIQESGNIEAAVDPAVKATELDPRSGEAWAHLAFLRYALSQTSPAAQTLAIQTLRRAGRILPGDFEIWLRLAELMEVDRNEEGALQAWLTVARLHPNPVYRGKVLADYALERALELAIHLKNYEARREAALDLYDRAPGDLRHQRILEELARDQVEAGFLAHAEESFTLLAQALPQEPAVWENIAIIQLRTSRYELALASLDKARALRPSPRISFNIGYCLMKVGRFEDAEARWRELLPTVRATLEEPAMPLQIRQFYASCLLLQGRPADLLALMAGWPEATADGDLAGFMAQALIQGRDWKGARDLVRDGIKRFPKQDLFRKAALIPPRTFEEGVLFRNASRKALSQLDLEAMAMLWSDFNRWDRCLQALEEARRAAPVRSVDLMLLEATALESLGQPGKAMEVLREGQRLDPSNTTLENNLGYLMLENDGDLAEAARLIEAALAGDPRNSSTMDSWGWVLYKQGKYPQAEEALRKATVLSPYSPEIHKHLGEVLLKQGRLQEALDEWERALAYVFPERRNLEKQVLDLRTRAARSRRAAADAAAPAEAPAEEEPVDMGPEDEGEDPL